MTNTQIQDLDGVVLKDGRTGAVVYIYEDKKTVTVDFAKQSTEPNAPDGWYYWTEDIPVTDIKKINWRAGIAAVDIDLEDK